MKLLCVFDMPCVGVVQGEYHRHRHDKDDEFGCFNVPWEPRSASDASASEAATAQTISTCPLSLECQTCGAMRSSSMRS